MESRTVGGIVAGSGGQRWAAGVQTLARSGGSFGGITQVVAFFI